MNLKNKINNYIWKYENTVLFLGTAIPTALMIYGVQKIDENYWQPKFCAEYNWLKEKPREEQIQYANKRNKVGEYSFFGVNESVKRWGAKEFIKSLDKCDCE